MQSTHYQDESKTVTRHTVRKNNHFLNCLARAITSWDLAPQDCQARHTHKHQSFVTLK